MEYGGSRSKWHSRSFFLEWMCKVRVRKKLRIGELERKLLHMLPAQGVAVGLAKETTRRQVRGIASAG